MRIKEIHTIDELLNALEEVRNTTTEILVLDLQGKRSNYNTATIAGGTSTVSAVLAYLIGAVA